MNNWFPWVVVSFGPVLLMSCMECGGGGVLSGPVARIESVKRTVEIEAVPGQMTREQLANGDLAGMVSFVSGEELLANLVRTRQAVEEFWAGNVATSFRISNHEVRNVDLLRIAGQVIDEHPDRSQPKFFRKHKEDWPRVIAVWETKSGHKILGLGQGNDSTGLFLKVAEGAFDPRYTYYGGGDGLKKYLPVENFLDVAKEFVEPQRTIYPHIETYRICPDECT